MTVVHNQLRRRIMSLKTVQTEWPGGFVEGEAVRHQRRNAHVVAVGPEFSAAFPGCVPIMYDSDGQNFVMVPADDLDPRFPKCHRSHHPAH